MDGTDGLHRTDGTRLNGPYRGRFAPSPTGPLHFGSLVGALASWLDARAHGGTWLVRIEDIDAPRTVPGADRQILATLERFGMRADEPPVWQSTRIGARGQVGHRFSTSHPGGLHGGHQRGSQPRLPHSPYATALERLQTAGLVYPCGCTRKEIADSLASTHARHTTLAYPGTCRGGLGGKPARAWRMRVPDGANAVVTFEDRWQGRQAQNLATEVGDFVLKRADGQWAYQLAVVVDDADAAITHVVRGADLLDSTARQIYLQRCLGLPTPAYLHVPVVVDAHGEKLSKQTGAAALDSSRPLPQLLAAARHLGLAQTAALDPRTSLATFYGQAVAEWAVRFAGDVR
jgi:glutamyl-Q tRNA(Asp) synthetase